MPSPTVEPGVLYLLPVWLGEQGGPGSMPEVNAETAKSITLYFAEHERTARHMLRRLVPAVDLPSLEIHRLDKDTDHTTVSEYIGMIAQGRNGAIVSEAGMPGIADPGAVLVREAHSKGIRVVPLIGPSSLLLALAASGLNGQYFTFHGYLPRDPRERQQALRGIESDIQRMGGAHLFIETPYRNDALLADILRTCAGATMLCIACDLTQHQEKVCTRSVAAWKTKTPGLKDRPTVFILGR
ncbi:MAG: SAM-dependent methyltransferase [Flavobacteriales bacterium]|nr:SAM-dependent methyltransferase [Flavobacteriales bacterium]